MKVVIVGGGAIGRLFGSYLRTGGNEVAIIDTDPLVVQEIQTSGLGVVGHLENHHDAVHYVPVRAMPDARSLDRCDLVLLTVKSFATRAAAHSVAHLVTETTPILFMQTGLGNQAVLRELFPVDHILAGLTFMSGTALGEARVRQGRWGVTFIGELSGKITPRLEKICEVFNECGIDTRWSHRIIARLWSKVITYAALNTMSSVLQVPNGRLLEEQEAVDLVRALLTEGQAVAEAHGVEPLGTELFDLFQEVCRESCNNISSMLQDLLNERPTEIDAQSGAICRYARQYGIEVPRHQTMVALVRLLAKWRPAMTR